MIRRTRMFFLVLFGTVISACAYTSNLSFKPNELETQSKPTEARPFYTSIAEKIIKPKCLSCHDGANSTSGIDLSTYGAIVDDGEVVRGDPMNSPLYLEVAGDEMPPSPETPLSTAEKDILYLWIAGGAPQYQPGEPTPAPTPPPVATPTPTPSPTPPPNAPHFAEVNTKVIQPSCVSCHKPPIPLGFVDLSNYKAVMAKKGLVVKGSPETSNFWKSIANDKMPKDAAHLPADLKKLVYDWIKSGAAE